MDRLITGDLTEEQIQEMIALYSQGYTMADLCRKFHAPWETVKRTLMVRGQKIRNHVESRDLRERIARGDDLIPDSDAVDLASEVAKAAQKIREGCKEEGLKGWSEKVKKQRSGAFTAVPWTVPVTEFFGLSQRKPIHIPLV